MMRALILASLLFVAELGAQVRFEAASIDLGELLQQDSRRVTLKVTNAGSASLDASGLTLACGCLVLVQGPTRLEAGASAELTVELATATMAGPQAKDISWTTAAGTSRCRLLFSVTPDFRVEPPMLHLGALARGARAEGKFRISARPGLDAELAVLMLPPGVKAELLPLPDAETARRSWTLTVSRDVAATERAGAFEDAIMLEARGARVTGLTLGISGRVEGVLRYRPELIDFGRIEAGKPGLSRLLLETADGSAFTIVSLIQGQGVSLVDTPGPAASTHDLQVRLDAGLPPGTARGFILLRLDHPVEKTIRISWRARIIEKNP